MRLTDLNSAQDIGANCLLAEIGPYNFLIDCGMHPKKDGNTCLPRLNHLPPLDYVVITHCHLDHVGALPIVLRKQPHVRILCSPGTALIIKRILRNSVSVMLRQRDELHLKELPLFTYDELDAVEKAIQPLPLLNPRILPGPDNAEIEVTLHPAGHVAGAVGCLFSYKRRKIFFTGDVLFQDQETVPAAQFPQGKIDTLIMETTHGATPPHEGVTRTSEAERLLDTINTTIVHGGSVLIPSFAFGRMQEMLMLLNDARRRKALATAPIFCSGLGVDLADYFDTMSRKAGFVNFRRQVMQDLAVKPLQRKFVEPGRDLPEKGIYVLSSGMLVENTPAWRVAANLLDHSRNTVCFVGYCDPSTPGGKLLAARQGDIFPFPSLDYTAQVRANIERFHFSGHAPRNELIDFARQCDPRAIVITHGDPPAREWFEEELAIELPHAKVINPIPGDPCQI